MWHQNEYQQQNLARRQRFRRNAFFCNCFAQLGQLKISPAEFDEVAAELGRTLDHFKVPEKEKGEVLAAFAAHKKEVTAGYVAAN